VTSAIMLPGILLDVSGDDGCPWREQQPTAFISAATQETHSEDGAAAHQPVSTANNDSLAATSSPVAICSMAVRLPGGVNSPSDFWRFLVDKGDGACKVPADRYNIDAYSSKVHKSGTIQTERGYYLNHLDLAHFDAAMFSLTKSEVEKLDPQHRLLLELTRECLEGAGETNWRGSSTGCYIGTFGEDWLQIQSRDTLESTRNRVTGYGDYLLSNRISYEYDFRGPRYVKRHNGMTY
jgi:acyl transferase domain-containing protein